MTISVAVLRAVRASPWPFAKGEGHLHVKWKLGAEGNKRVLSEVIARGEFTAAQALHRMTDNMVNTDGTPNGPSTRPTLASKWGPGGMACVRQPASVVNAHVEALRQHLADMVSAELTRQSAASAAAAVDLTADTDDEEPPRPPSQAVPSDRGDDAASLALARRLQAESDAAFASELAAGGGAPGKRRQSPATGDELTASQRRRIHGYDPETNSIQKNYDFDGNHTLDHKGWGADSNTSAAPSVVERARTDRSCCRMCGGPIIKGEIRLGRPEKKRGQQVIGWNHVRCVRPLLSADEWPAVEGWAALDDEERRGLLEAR